jgi:hypothetical protein
MAGQGTYTAYQQLRPLEGDVSTDIIKQEELGFKRKAIEEQRAKNKAEAAAKLKEEKLKELKDVKYGVNPDVKVQTLTDYGAKALMMANDRISEISYKLYTGNHAPEEEADLRLQLNNLQSIPEQLKNSASALTEQATLYKKQLSEGKIRPNLKFENFINNGANGWQPHIDSKGNFMTAFMDKDINGDGVVDKLDLVGYDDLVGHTEMFKFDNAYNRKELLASDIKAIEAPVNTTDNGSLKIKKIGFDDIDKTTGIPVVVLEKAKTNLYNQDGTPNDILRDFAYEANVPLTIKDAAGKEVPNQKGLEKVVQDYAREIDFGIKKSREEERNLERERMALDDSHYKQTRADNQKRPKPVVIDTKEAALTENVLEDSSYTDGNGRKHVRTVNRVAHSDLLPKAYSFPDGIEMDNVGGKKSELNNMTINNVFIGKNGKLYFEAKVLDEKSSGEKTKGEDGVITYKYGAKYKGVTRKATGETAGKIASAMGYNSVSQALISLRKLNGYDANSNLEGEENKKNNTKKQESNTIKSGYTEGGYRFKGGNANDPKNWEKI